MKLSAGEAATFERFSHRLSGGEVLELHRVVQRVVDDHERHAKIQILDTAITKIRAADSGRRHATGTGVALAISCIEGIRRKL